MSTQAIQLVRPNVMIGLTHTQDGRSIIRESKVLKVGVGHAIGKACDVYVNGDGKWVVRSATEADRKLKFETVCTVDSRKEAEAAFTAAWKKAPMCNYPRKTQYFNFTRRVTTAEGAQIYVPDFDAIEAHSFTNPDKPGTPTEIDIVFFDNEPFQGGFQNWAASELKCFGDGENALRVLAMAKTAPELELAGIARAQGGKHFPIVGGCHNHGCVYSKETEIGGRVQPAPCGPSATITFQLIRNIRVGGTAFFHTGSWKSISQIWSSIERIKSFTGGKIAGVPLKLVVRQDRTNHNGQPAMQPTVLIEFRAEDMEQLRSRLIEQAWRFENSTLDRTPQLIGEPADLPDDADAEVTDEAEPTPAPVAATATATATAALSESLARAREAREPAIIVPWKDDAGMRSEFRTQRSRISETRFLEVLSNHNFQLGTCSADDKRAAAAWRDMAALADSPKAAKPSVLPDDPF